MLEPCISQVPSTFFTAQPWLITQLVIYIMQRKRTYPFHQLVVDTVLLQKTKVLWTIGTGTTC